MSPDPVRIEVTGSNPPASTNEVITMGTLIRFLSFPGAPKPEKDRCFTCGRLFDCCCYGCDCLATFNDDGESPTLCGLSKRGCRDMLAMFSVPPPDDPKVVRLTARYRRKNL